MFVYTSTYPSLTEFYRTLNALIYGQRIFKTFYIQYLSSLLFASDMFRNQSHFIILPTNASLIPQTHTGVSRNVVSHVDRGVILESVEMLCLMWIGV